MQEQFQFFERVTFQNIGTVSEADVIEKLECEDQALCIVNTKKRAQNLYRKMKGEGVFHLSTAMYPNHRRRVLGKIRELLQKGERCILISTSLVEAGVDLDFQAVYRQLAGVDSMIQAAGRCNREGKRDAEESFAYVFQFEDRENVPGQQLSIDVSKMLLQEEADIFSIDGAERYFETLYHFRGESLDKKKILEEFQNKRYNFAKAAEEFRLIEENTFTIFVGKEKEAEELLWQIKNQGYTKAGIRKASQYCIQLYESDAKELQRAGMLGMISEDMKDFYELLNAEQYTEEMGLILEVEPGKALFK